MIISPNRLRKQSVNWANGRSNFSIPDSMCNRREGLVPSEPYSWCILRPSSLPLMV